jgi:hypothetical protein
MCLGGSIGGAMGLYRMEIRLNSLYGKELYNKLGE